MSNESEQMSQEAEALMGALELPSLATEARAMQAIDAAEELKIEVLGFFKNRIASITRAERIKELMYEQLEVDIQSGNLNFDQKMTLLLRLDRDNNDAADSIISMFRNNGGGNGGWSLLTDIVRTDRDKTDLAKAIENYSPEQLRLINETFKVLRDIAETGGTVSIETPEKTVEGI